MALKEGCYAVRSRANVRATGREVLLPSRNARYFTHLFDFDAHLSLEIIQIFLFFVVVAKVLHVQHLTNDVVCRSFLDNSVSQSGVRVCLVEEQLLLFLQETRNVPS